jgi:multidrug efflux pump subunit AcrB
MLLRDFCIQRPVFAIAINLFLLVGGVYALLTLPVRNLISPWLSSPPYFQVAVRS